MIVTALHPAGAVEPIDTDGPGARERLAALYPPPGLRANLVASVDGATQDAAGTSAGLTGGADRVILGAIRSVSDTVLVGAATLRAEGALVPQSTHLTVLTTSGDFTGAVLREGIPEGRILVVGPAVARDRVRRTLEAPHEYLGVDGDRAVPLPTVIRALRERGLERIVCEGGPRLVGQLLAAGLVDELCLTTVPRLMGHRGSMFGGASAGPRPLELAQLLRDDAGFLYARWLVRR